MRILFDVRPLQSASAGRGIGRYTYELLAGLSRRGPAHEFTLLRLADQVPPALPEGVRASWLDYRPRAPEQLRGYLDAFLLPHLLATASVDLYHSPEYGLPITGTLPAVVSVHDLTPWRVHHPSYRRQRLRWALQIRLIARARAAVCDSQHTRDDLVRARYAGPARAQMVYPGINPIFFRRPPEGAMAAVRARFGTDFLLAVGECDWRKRIEHALAALAASGRSDSRLVIIGPNQRHSARIRRLASGLRVTDRVVLAGSVSDQELWAAYWSARMLLFPSRYEGFGFPVLEAAAAGLPIVAYANSAVAEVIGAAVPLAPEGDLTSFIRRAQAVEIGGVDTGEAERGRQRAATFTWDRAADQLTSIYAEVTGRRP